MFYECDYFSKILILTPLNKISFLIEISFSVSGCFFSFLLKNVDR